MAFASYDILEPTELDFLRGLLDRACSEKGIGLIHPDASLIAGDLINWYLFGIRDPDVLKTMLDPLAAAEARLQQAAKLPSAFRIATLAVD